MVRLDLEGHREPVVHPEREESLVRMELQEHPVNEDSQDYPDPLDHLDRQDLEARLALRADKVHEERLELQ